MEPLRPASAVSLLRNGNQNRGFISFHVLQELDNLKKDPCLGRIVFRIASLKGIRSEAYRESAPFHPEAEHFTGFVPSPEEAVPNSFTWNERN